MSNNISENKGENLSYGCTGISSAIGSSGLAQAPIIMFGNEEQKKEYLGLMTGSEKNFSGLLRDRTGNWF